MIGVGREGMATGVGLTGPVTPPVRKQRAVSAVYSSFLLVMKSESSSLNPIWKIPPSAPPSPEANLV